MKFYIILLLVFVLLVSGCTQQTDNQQEGKRLTEDASPEEFPREFKDIYLGVWMPAVSAKGMQSLEKREDLISLGANTVAFGIGINYLSDGRVREVDYEEVRELIRYYKEVGLAVLFSPEPVDAAIRGEPGPVPENIKDKFLEEYDKIIVELAKIAEEENVEIFSPMNELDYKLGTEIASSWGQEVLPKIKTVFKGKVLWKGSLGWETEEIDFSGYDIVGFTTFPHSGIENYKEDVGSKIENLKKTAEKDSVREVFVSEFGTYAPVRIAKEDEPKSIEYVFETGKGKVTGFFVLDPPKGFGTPIKGSPLEEATRNGFEYILSEDDEIMVEDGKSETHQNVETTVQKEGTNKNEPAKGVTWSADTGEWKPSSTPPACPESLISQTPVDINLATSILYPGQLRGGQYKAHGGFRFDNSENEDITVKAPLDGFLVKGSRYIEGGEVQYMFDIINSCGIMVRFDHLLTLSPKFQEAAEKFRPAVEDDSRTTNIDPIEIKAGEIVATAVGFKKTNNVAVDFGVYDLRQKNEASKNPEWLQQHDNEQAPYALCWLDLLSGDSTKAKSLPGGDSVSGKQSDYCK